MPDITKIPLSASTDFRGVVVVATAIGTGTTIHTAQASAVAGNADAVYLRAYNSSTTSTETLVLGWGGTTDPDDLQSFRIPALGTIKIEGFLRNSLILKAASTTASTVILFGDVSRAS